MPRFFFDRSHAHHYRDDVIGAEFDSADAALACAVETAIELAAAMVAAGLSLEEHSIVVRDEAGLRIGEVDLAKTRGDLQ